MNFREARLLEALKADVVQARRRKREPFSIWNDNIDQFIGLAEAHGSRRVAEYFASALEQCLGEAHGRLLGKVAALWALNRSKDTRVGF